MIPLIGAGIASVALAAISYAWGAGVAFGAFVAGGLLLGWSMNLLSPAEDPPGRAESGSPDESWLGDADVWNDPAARSAGDRIASERDPLDELAEIVTGRPSHAP